MHRNGHPGRAAGDGRVHQIGVDVQELVGIVATAAQILALRRIAEIGHEHLVELQVGATRLAERPNRLGVGLPEVGEERLHLGIGGLLDRLPAAAVVQRRGRRDRHLGRGFRHRLQELEVLDHRMIGKIDLAVDMQAFGLGFRALELQPLSHAHQLDAVQGGQEIVVPPRATELAIGHALQADRFLFGDELSDLGVLDRLQLRRRELSRRALRSRFLDGCAAQQAADLIGTKRRFGTLHGASPWTA